MARRFQSVSRFPARGARRSTSWLTGPQLVSTATGTVGTIQGFTTGLQILDEGVTLVRTRGEVLFRVTAAAGVGDEMGGAVGIAIASENAFGVGITAIMDPFVDSEWDGWLWHSFFRVGGLVNDGAGFQRIEIDSKAMRKVAALDVLYGVIKVETEIGTVTLVMAADTRMLFKIS